MPAKSRAQHGLMGMVLAYKRGKLKADDVPPRVRERVKRMASDMSESEVEHYTSTPREGLPSYKKRPASQYRRARA